MSPYRSVFQAGLFNGQVAVVTGGGSGIGRSFQSSRRTRGVLAR